MFWNLFKKEEDKKEETFKKPFDNIKDFDCGNCSMKDVCEVKRGKRKIPCTFKQSLPDDFDFNKETIFIIDDNPGIVSIIMDEFEYLEELGKLNLTDYNILSFTTKDAGFQYIATQEVYGTKLNIKYAIIDITLIGSIMTDKGNVILDGIDILGVLKQYNDLKSFIFFTGNNLNPYIKSNKEKIEKYNNLYDENIFEKIVFKASQQSEDESRILYNALFENEE